MAKWCLAHHTESFLYTHFEELVTKNQQENNIELLPIGLAHISQLEKLPSHHEENGGIPEGKEVW